MSHLTDEQLEEILQGHAKASEHVDRCPVCQARLSQARVLARRVRQAFSSIHAGSELAERIRARTAAGRPAGGTRLGSRVIPVRGRRQMWSGLAVAAAVLMMVMLRSSPMGMLPRTHAVPAALAGIHRTNLDFLEQLLAEHGSPRECECPKSKSAKGAAMPCCQRGLCLCGCQVREFQGRPVECCVVREPNGPAISVVLVPDSPRALGLTRAARTTGAGHAIWQASSGPCNIASVRLGNASCCVMGETSQEVLIALLNALEK
ncbi:MAG: hypothetical protein FJ280_14485 [Planctomycetes bacterium]|nr:hypothetical protein [Planctomycetota bacterium]